MALSNKIRELRFKNGEMTQKHLAERVGVSRQTMNAIENSKHAPTIDVAIRIADVFGIFVDQLFECNYDGKPERRPAIPTATPAKTMVYTKRPPDEYSEPADNDAPAESAERRSKTEDVEDKMTLADLRNLI